MRRMMQSDHAAKQINEEKKQMAMRTARSRANKEKWNRNSTVFSFAILAIVIILNNQGVGWEIVAPVAMIGLTLVWLMGWLQGRQVYSDFYSEELSKLEQEETTKEMEEEPIEEKVRRAIRDMWR